MPVSVPVINVIEQLEGESGFNRHNEWFPHLFAHVHDSIWGGTRMEGTPLGLLIRTSDKNPGKDIIERARECWKRQEMCYFVFDPRKSNLLPTMENMALYGSIPAETLAEDAVVMLRIDAMEQHDYADANMGIAMDSLFLRMDLNTLRVAPSAEERVRLNG